MLRMQFGENIEKQRKVSGVTIMASLSILVHQYHVLAFEPVDLADVDFVVKENRMNPNIRNGEVFVISGYTMILENIASYLHDGKIPDFDKCCKYPIYSRFEDEIHITPEFPEVFMSNNMCSDIINGFKIISSMEGLNRHAMSLGFIWCNAMLSSNGYIPFGIYEHMFEKIKNSQPANHGDLIVEIISNYNKTEIEREKESIRQEMSL